MQRDIIIHVDLLASQYPTGVEMYLHRLLQGVKKYAQEDLRYWVWFGGQVTPLESMGQRYTAFNRRPLTYFYPYWEYPPIKNMPSDLHFPLVFEPHFFIHQHQLPSIILVQDMSCFDRPQDHPWYRVVKHKFFLPNMMLEAKAVMVPTEFVRERVLHFCSKLHPNKVHVVHLGIDPEEMQIPAPIRRVKSMLLVGTREPRKGVAEIFPVLERFLAEHGDWEVWLVGKVGWKNRRLASHAKIREFGYVSHEKLKELYAACGVFLYPSHYEGFGYPVLEALSAGATCIVRGIPALVEWIPNEVMRFSTLDDLQKKLAKIVSQPVFDPLNLFPRLSLQRSIEQFESCFLM